MSFSPFNDLVVPVGRGWDWHCLEATQGSTAG